MDLQQAYRAERAPLFVPAHDSGRMVECRERAAQALRSARVKVAWDAAAGVTLSEWEAERADDPPFCGRVRLMVRDDPMSPPDDFDGSEKDLQEARERARRDGMNGVEAQFWNGADWESVDSVWGFIGEDWKGSGYDVDLMSAALNALAAHDRTEAEALESTRPDLYQH